MILFFLFFFSFYFSLSAFTRSRANEQLWIIAILGGGNSLFYEKNYNRW